MVGFVMLCCFWVWVVCMLYNGGAMWFPIGFDVPGPISLGSHPANVHTVDHVGPTPLQSSVYSTGFVF